MTTWNVVSIRPGILEGGKARGGGSILATDYNSKIINDIKMKFGKVIENYKRINLL